MRTNIDIDDQLMRQAMRCSGSRTKKAAVEAGLRFSRKPMPKDRFGAFAAMCDGRGIDGPVSSRSISGISDERGNCRHNRLD